MTEHTPGPWTQTFAFISGPNQEHIATMNYDPKVHDLCQANARVVIAAPELLEALDSLLKLRSVSTVEEAVREYPHGKEAVADELAAFNRARAAVARATNTEN